MNYIINQVFLARKSTRKEYYMSTVPQFHGSDLEEIEKYYKIPKEEIVGFGANVNPLGLSPFVKEKLAANLDIITTYPDRNYTSLRKVISQYCNVDPGHIVVGNGSTELISMLIHHRHPKRALLLGPTYSEYERELTLCGGEIVMYNLSEENDFQLDFDDFFKHLDNSIDLLIICNPNNPTSSAITVCDMERILKHCKENNIFVMVDETYVEFAPCVEEITSMSLVAEHDNIMILRGVSKFFAAPGLRLGYGVTSNVHFLNVILKNQNPWTLNSIGAYAGELMLQDTEYIQKTRDLILEEHKKIHSALLEIPELKAYKPMANFILVKILKEDVTSFDVFDFLIRRKLMVRDCASFKCLDGEFIRFCIMNPEDNERLLKGLKEFFNKKTPTS